jgi:hypothetical protein
VEEERAHLCKDESMAEVSLGGERKKRSGWNGDTLRRDALKCADSAVCGQVISCSCGQERWSDARRVEWRYKSESEKTQDRLK